MYSLSTSPFGLMCVALHGVAAHLPKQANKKPNLSIQHLFVATVETGASLWHSNLLGHNPSTWILSVYIQMISVEGGLYFPLKSMEFKNASFCLNHEGLTGLIVLRVMFHGQPRKHRRKAAPNSWENFQSGLGCGSGGGGGGRRNRTEDFLPRSFC